MGWNFKINREFKIMVNKKHLLKRNFLGRH